MKDIKNLKSCIDIFVNGARLNFNMFGHIEPVFAFLMDGRLKICNLFWEKPEDKDEFSQMVQNMIAAGAINEYLMVVEAWTAAASESDHSKVTDWLKEHGTLSSFPERQEAVMVQYCSSTEEIQYIAKIERKEEEATLGEWQINVTPVDINLCQLSTRFQGLFPRSKANLN